MARTSVKLVVWLALPCVAACASERNAAGTVASRGAAAGADTFDVAYHGVGGAIEAPFKDFNIVRDQIPAVLKRAALAPYDTKAVATCAALTEEVAALDLALGPDLDTPDLEKSHDMYARGAGLAADAAVDAMTHAAVAYIPMRSVVRRLSGADKLEKATKKAVLAGSVRRGFLKAIGMERGCGWPAAPLGSDATNPTVTIAAAAAAAPSPATLQVAAAAPAATGVKLAAVSATHPPLAAAPSPAATGATLTPISAPLAPEAAAAAH